ncbi:MAG: hypothetical protein WBL07_02670 [Thiothrix litoralis]|uniref:hypothetical protein n=1 Tax=Thiothrix litoralis TaxID=2891210 RepID=UPI003C7204C3
MKITTEMIQATYQAAKHVYHDRITKNDAIDSLEIKHGINRGSASDYIVNFKKMMDGEKYTRTKNEEATDYFLTQISVHDNFPNPRFSRSKLPFHLG